MSVDMRAPKRDRRLKCCVETCLQRRVSEGMLVCPAHLSTLPETVVGRIRSGWHGLKGEELAPYVARVVEVQALQLAVSR